MDRVAVFVDAGYVYAQGSALISGRKARREEILLDDAQILARLKAVAMTLTQLPLLRVYWYDATRGVPSPQQIEMASAPDVKLRLGLLNSEGVQKGVDSLIIADLITLGRNGAISDAVVLSGDEDLRVGVQMAQERGVRVHLLGIHPGRGTVSSLLIQEADTFNTLSEEDVRGFMTIVVRPDVPAAPVTPDQPALGPEVASAIVTGVIKKLDPSSLMGYQRELASTGSLPQTVDSQILVLASRHLGRVLAPEEKRSLRKQAREDLRGLSPGSD